MNNPYDLIIFDADDTLVARDTGEYLRPDTIEHFRHLHAMGIHTAIATNQGGPACNQAGWGTSSKYPTLEYTLERFDRIETELETRIFMCLAFYSKKSKMWCFTDAQSWDIGREWRKPSPGMLLEAMSRYGTTPDRTLMVGDSEDDEGAAKNAGCAFMSPQAYFGS